MFIGILSQGGGAGNSALGFGLNKRKKQIYGQTKEQHEIQNQKVTASKRPKSKAARVENYKATKKELNDYNNEQNDDSDIEANDFNTEA